jgi:enterobactin synthetase component D
VASVPAPIATLPSRFGTLGLVDASDAGDSGLPHVTLADALATLHADEQRAADALAPLRRRDWIAGRAALRALFAAAGAEPPPAPLASDDRGAPLVPAGWVASISHKRGLAAAVLAPDHGWTVGVDVERAAPPRVDLSARILTDAERISLAALPPEARGRRTTLAFAIKEAVYKAVDPFVRRYVGFREVELAITDDGTAAVRPVDGDAIPLVIEAEWREHAGLWLCVARARR